MKSSNKINEINVEEIKKIPHAVGVYVFRGKTSFPLYIGKSLDLRSRVMSHIRNPNETKMINQSDKIEFIVDEIELQLHQGIRKEVEAIEIGEMILTHLKDINEVAYIRFASVYRQFHGINDFITTLESLKPLKKEQFASVI